MVHRRLDDDNESTGLKVLLYTIVQSARIVHMEAIMKGQAICKDCGTGTLDNEMNEQFILSEDGETAVCGICGSNHIDGELYFEEEA